MKSAKMKKRKESTRGNALLGIARTIDFEQYIKETSRTELSPEKYVKAFEVKEILRFFHGISGVTTETGELMDVLKKRVIYGKDVDWINVVEELGDIMWYMALLIDLAGRHTGLSFKDILERNLQKLKTRYPDKFSTKKALKRNLGKERRALAGPMRDLAAMVDDKGVPLFATVP